jgi:dihydrofolate reductase
VPIFILTRREPASLPLQFPLVTYVNDVVRAMTQAKEAAGDKNILVHGAGTAQLALAVGVLDEMELHVIPVLFGQGRRLFDGLPPEQIELERTRILEGENGVTHMHYLVQRWGQSSRSIPMSTVLSLAWIRFDNMEWGNEALRGACRRRQGGHRWTIGRQQRRDRQRAFEAPAPDPDGWLVLDADRNQVSLEQFLVADAMVLGRKTYEGLAAVWPQLAADPTLGC